MKKLHLVLIACMLFALPIFCCASASAKDASPALKTYMYTNTDDTAFYRDSALTNRRGTANFATKMQLLSVNSAGTIAKVKYNSYTYYVRANKLSNMTAVATGLTNKLYTKSSSASATKGYVIRGQKMEVLGQITKKGTIYLKVRVNKTYTNNLGSAVKFASSQVGYVKKANTGEYSEMMVTNKTTGMYKKGRYYLVGVSHKFVGMGNVVKVIFSTSKWAKVEYDGAIWYCNTGNLDPYILNVTGKNLSMYRTTSATSEKLSTYYWNTPIQVLYKQVASGKTYYFCKKGSNEGFMLASGLNMTEEVVTTTNTYLYRTASEGSKTLTDAPTYTRATVISADETFTKAKMEGTTGFLLNEDIAHPTAVISGAYYSTGYNCYKDSPAGYFDEEEVEILATSRSVKQAYVRTASGEEYWIRTESMMPEGLVEGDPDDNDPYLYAAQMKVKLYYKPNLKGGYKVIPLCEPVVFLNSHLNDEGEGFVEVDYKGTVYYLYQRAGEYQLWAKLPQLNQGQTYTQQAILDYALNICFNQKTKYFSTFPYGRGEIVDGYQRFHCSGFVSYVFNNVLKGYKYDIPTKCSKLDRVEYCDTKSKYKATVVWDKRPQAHEDGSEVGEWDANIQPGDVLLFEYGDDDIYMDHTGIYLGGGRFIHSTTYSGFNRVVISNIEDVFTADNELTVIMRFLPKKDLLAPVE